MPAYSQPARRSTVDRVLRQENGIPLDYRASVVEYMLPAADSASCSAIFTSYEGSDQDSARPLVFFFNGGPGASSSPLHMYAFGPKRLERMQDSLRLSDNPYTLIKVADLVFIDPPGTGFTRIIDDQRAGKYFDVATDAATIAKLIDQWRTEHGKEKRPFFICGESYGTIRAAKIASLMVGQPLKGVLLFSPVLDMSMVAPVSGNELPYGLSLPSMETIAWYHKKSHRNMRSVSEVFEQSVRWVNTQYMPALFTGTEKKLAPDLAARLGLPLEFINEKRCRVKPDDFEVMLLDAQHLRIGKLNGKVSKPYDRLKQSYSAREDPSLVVNTDITKDAVGRYFIDSLGFRAEGLYRGINFGVNARWQWQSMDAYRGYYSVLPDLEEAMKTQGELRLLLAGGYFDLATPWYAARFLIDHSAVPKDRTVLMAYPTGHSIFEEPRQLFWFSGQVRSFIQSKTAH